MFLSVFDIFKVGIGPSSSHTMGPMVAAGRFLDIVRARHDPEPGAGEPSHLTCHLHGSLAWTGKGHASDRAIILGLSGFEPATLDPDTAEAAIAGNAATRTVTPPDLPTLAFDPETDLVFDYGPPLPGHANGMRFRCLDEAGRLRHEEIYYSTGGGFVTSAGELARGSAEKTADAVLEAVPYPFRTAHEMLRMGEASGVSIAGMKRANECVHVAPEELDRRLDGIWAAMDNCIERGLATEGELPGGLKVKRRAAAIHAKLQEERGLNILQPHVVNDWISCYAMAVNEENAAGGKVVTSPTNGAAGVVPAVIRYYLDHCIGASTSDVRTFLLTAAAVGGLIKHNASISGAEVGCQGEWDRRRRWQRRACAQCSAAPTPRSRMLQKSRSSITSG
jgi:L-serine dehydratase